MATTLYPDSRADAQTLARTLLDAAGPDGHDQVQTSTDGPAGIAFVISDELYELVFTSGDTTAPPARRDAEHGSAGRTDGADSSGGSGPAVDEPTVSAPAGDQDAPRAVGDLDEEDTAGTDAGEAETGRTSAAPARARRRPR